MGRASSGDDGGLAEGLRVVAEPARVEVEVEDPAADPAYAARYPHALRSA
jgi:hypothetical protein